LIPPALAEHAIWTAAVERALERMLTQGMLDAIDLEASD